MVIGRPRPKFCGRASARGPIDLKTETNTEEPGIRIDSFGGLGISDVWILEPDMADEGLVVISPSAFSSFKMMQISILAHVPYMLTLRSPLRPEELLA